MVSIEITIYIYILYIYTFPLNVFLVNKRYICCHDFPPFSSGLKHSVCSFRGWTPFEASAKFPFGSWWCGPPMPGHPASKNSEAG